MPFSQSLAWTRWCAWSPWDCTVFQLEADAAIKSAKLGNLEPAYKFIEKWQEVADQNETAAAAIQSTLDELGSLLLETVKAGGEALNTLVNPLIIPLAVGALFIFAWKM